MSDTLSTAGLNQVLGEFIEYYLSNIKDTWCPWDEELEKNGFRQVYRDIWICKMKLGKNMRSTLHELGIDAGTIRELPNQTFSKMVVRGKAQWAFNLKVLPRDEVVVQIVFWPIKKIGCTII